MLFHQKTMKLGHHFLVYPLVKEMRESMYPVILSQTKIQLLRELDIDVEKQNSIHWPFGAVVLMAKWNAFH